MLFPTLHFGHSRVGFCSAFLLRTLGKAGSERKRSVSRDGNTVRQKAANFSFCFFFVYRLTSIICIHSRGLDGRDGVRLGLELDGLLSVGFDGYVDNGIGMDRDLWINRRVGWCKQYQLYTAIGLVFMKARTASQTHPFRAES